MDDITTIARDALSTSDRLREPAGPGRTVAPVAPVKARPPRQAAAATEPTGAEPEAEAPKDVVSWFRAETEKLVPRFQEAEQQARDSIARRHADLGQVRERVRAMPGLPDSPELPDAPTAPKITARPFLESVPGEPATQSLNRALAGLGLLTQMAVGIRGGFPGGALAAYTGALQGWKAGDLRRGANEWRNYMGELQTYDRDVRAIRAKFDDAIKRWGADKDRLGLEVGIIAAEHDLGREATELAFREPERALAQLNTTAKVISDQQTVAANIALKHVMFLSDREIGLRNLAVKEADLSRKIEKDAANEALIREGMGPQAGAAPGAPQMQRSVTFGPSGPSITFSPVPPASGAATTMALGSARLGQAVAGIDRVQQTPELKEMAESYIGPVAGWWSTFQKVAPGSVAGQVPTEVVDLEQNLASLQNYTIKLVTGAQMSEREAARIMRELPQMTDPPNVFWRKYENAKTNISNMERIVAAAQRGRLTGDSPVQRPDSPGGTIRVLSPEGEEYEVPASTDLSAYPGWRRQ